MSFNVDVLMFKVANLPVNLLHYRQHIVRKQVEIYVGIALQLSPFYRHYFKTLNSKIVYFGVHQVYQRRRATLTKIGLMINSYSSGFRQARITSKGMDEWKSPIHDSELFRLFKTFFDGLPQYGHSQSEKKLGLGDKYHRSIKVHT